MDSFLNRGAIAFVTRRRGLQVLLTSTTMQLHAAHLQSRCLFLSHSFQTLSSCAMVSN